MRLTNALFSKNIIELQKIEKAYNMKNDYILSALIKKPAESFIIQIKSGGCYRRKLSECCPIAEM